MLGVATSVHTYQDWSCLAVPPILLRSLAVCSPFLPRLLLVNLSDNKRTTIGQQSNNNRTTIEHKSMLLPCYIEGALWLHITYNPYLLAKLVIRGCSGLFQSKEKIRFVS